MRPDFSDDRGSEGEIRDEMSVHDVDYANQLLGNGCIYGRWSRVGVVCTV